MNIPTDALVMTVVLIVGLIYFKMQKENKKSAEDGDTVIDLNKIVRSKRRRNADEEEWLNK